VYSQLDGANIGFPSEPREIVWFMKMMKQAAPAITDDEIKGIETVLRRGAKAEKT
jgi:hypothetical protein